MHQRGLVKQAWQAAGLYDGKDPALPAFLRLLDATATDCWPQLIAECRKNFAAYKAKLADPIWNTGDKLLRLNLIRSADLALPDEAAILQKYVAKCDPQRDALELNAFVQTGSPQLTKAVSKLVAMASDRKIMPSAAAPAKSPEKIRAAPGAAKQVRGAHHPRRPK
jgi:hypothetical protein